MRNGTRHAKKRVAFFGADSDGLQPGDNIGNRQKFSENRINADDIGNRLTNGDISETVRDDIGNSIGGAPTHQQSGILASLEGKGRKRRDPSSLDRRGSNFLVGGVNPLVSGNHALVSMFATRSEESAPETLRPASRNISPAEPGRSSTKEAEDSRRGPRKNERSTDSSDRWLKRLLELDEEERADVTSTGDPKQKAAQARTVLSEIFEKAGAMVAIGTEILTETSSGRPNVIVSFEDIDLGLESGKRISDVFVPESISLLALNFLVNKIVNRIPEDRVRVQVLPRGTKIPVASVSPKRVTESELAEVDSESSS